MSKNESLPELRELLRWAQHHVPRSVPQVLEFLDRAYRVLGHDYAHSGSGRLTSPAGKQKWGDRVATDSVLDIARAAHEANRVYCNALGDTSQPPWDEAPNWQQLSVIAGVNAILDGSASTPEEQHEGWMDAKAHDGWTYGETKDPALKTHPCMLPYLELPASQRAKDKIFRGVVIGMADHMNRREALGGELRGGRP